MKGQLSGPTRRHTEALMCRSAVRSRSTLLVEDARAPQLVHAYAQASMAALAVELHEEALPALTCQATLAGSTSMRARTLSRE
mgnify:CR=1 FL=1